MHKVPQASYKIRYFSRLRGERVHDIVAHVYYRIFGVPFLLDMANEFDTLVEIGPGHRRFGPCVLLECKY